MFEPISSLIKRKVLPFDKEIKALHVQQAFETAMKDRFSENVAKMLKPKQFRNGLLIVSAQNSVLIQELQIKREEIISLINKELKRDLVKRIRFIL